MDAGSWVLAVATIILVMVTGYYAYQTRNIVSRMDQERENLVRPWLVFTVVPWEANLLKLRIENAGQGPALNIIGTLVGHLREGQMVELPWQYAAMAPQAYEEFGFPTKEHDAPHRHEKEAILEKFTSVGVSLQYQSVTGSKYSLEKTIDISPLTKSWIESRMMATQDHPSRLGPRIAREMERIRKELEKLAGNRNL